MHADIRLVGALIGQWMLGDELDAGIDRPQHAAGTGRAALLKIPVDGVNIGERLRPILQAHKRPRRFQSASTSSSEASGPRRAASMAARSSSLRR